jgi:hypothetical protein
MDHGFCRMCGTLLNPFTKACAACGIADRSDFDRELLMDDDASFDVLDAFFREATEPDADYGNEDPSFID